jgi:predicted permease
MSDLRFAVRLLAKNPTFTAVAVTLLAVGIGANALIFSAFDAVLWRPLPVRRPEELVRMVQRIPRIGTASNFHYSFYQMLREHSTTLSAVFGEAPIDVAMHHPAPAEQVRVHMATPEFFQVLGIPALVGRTLTEDDDASANSGTPPAVLSYGFWQRRFDGDAQAIGRTIVLKGRPFVIVGVMPRAFNGTSVDTAPDVRVPFDAFEALWPWAEPFHVEKAQLDLGGRLKPGVTRAQAETETLALWQAAIEPYSADNPHGRGVYDALRTGMALDSLERGISILRERYGGALRLLLLSVGLLLLMVCANVTGLLLTRVVGRREEIAVRLALGATRGRLARQVLTESFVLTGLGAIGGVLLAFVFSGSMVRMLPPLRDIVTRPLTLSVDFAPDWRVLLFALAVSILTALLSGVAPAIAFSRRSIESMLRGARSSGWRSHQAVVVLQIALCTLLLAVASLLVRTFEQLHSLDAGFDRDHVVTFTADPSLSGYAPPREHALLSALTGRIREIPDVVSLAFAARGVLRERGIGMTVAPTGQSPLTADFLSTNVNVVSPEYFATMSIPLVAGRDFTSADDPRAKPGKVVVNQAFVRRFFPNVDPLGQRFGAGPPQRVVGPMFEIIGVVSDAKYRSMREPMMPAVYQLSHEFDSFVLHVRTRGRPESIVESVRQALSALDPAVPFIEISTLAEDVDATTAGERLTAALASIFGLIALLLTAVGLYGLLAYLVAHRRREIGIRIALGAQAADIGILVGRHALAMVVGGIMLGLGAVASAAQSMRSLLYGVAPSDPRSLAAAAVFVAVVAALAIAIAISRAAHIEPASALRQEN